MENLFDTPIRIFLGLVSGVAFGFLLQKGQVGKFHYVLGSFLLKEFTAAKIIAVAILVGSVGFWALLPHGAIDMKIKPMLVGGVVLGGILFALGLSIFGYCPGTSVAASAEGHRDARIGVVGMLTGALAFVLAYPLLDDLIHWGGDFGKITLPEVTNTSAWVWVAGLAIVCIVAYMLVEKKSRSGPLTSEKRFSNKTIMDT